MPSYRYSRLGRSSPTCRKVSKAFIVIFILCIITSITILLLNPILSVSIVPLSPVDLRSSPLISVTANVSSWFHSSKLIKYHWTLPDGTSSTSASPSWNASLISQYVNSMGSNSNTSLPSFSLSVSGILPFIKMHAVAVPFEYFTTSDALMDLSTASFNCTGLPDGQLVVPSQNVTIGSILLVDSSCGTARMVNNIMQVMPNGYVLVNTSSVGITDVFQELSTSGSLPGGTSQSLLPSRSLGGSKFLEWLLEPGSISVSGSASAQVSVTPLVHFSPSLTYSFLVSGWHVQHASFGVSGDLTLGIALKAEISGEASLTASVPLCPPMKGEILWLPIGPPPGVPLVPALTAEASVQFTFQAADTISASTQLTISASVSTTYDQQNGWSAGNSFSTSKFYSPPSSLTSCGWSIEVTMRVAMEISLFDFYPSLSLGPSAGFKLSATSAPEKAPTTTLQNLQMKPRISSNNFVEFIETEDNVSFALDPSASSRMRGLEESSDSEDCKYCDDAPLGTNPGYMSAELVGIWTPWDVDFSILPWLSKSWPLGEQESSPWWQQCYDLGDTSKCQSCCGPPQQTMWTTTFSSPFGPANQAAWFVPCSTFPWLVTSDRYCFVSMPQTTPNVPPGGCYMWLSMSACNTPSSFTFGLDFQTAQGGNANGHWACSTDCSLVATLTIGEGGSTLLLQGGNLNPLTFTKTAYTSPDLSVFSGAYCQQTK